MRKIIVFILLNILINNILLAQDKYEKISFDEFIVKVEETFNVKFFYKKEWIENLKVNKVDFNNELSTILEEAIKEKSFIKYYIYDNKFIILTRLDNVDQTGKYIKSAYTQTNYKPNSELSESENTIHYIGVAGSKKKIAAISGNIKESILGHNLRGVEIIADEGKIGTTTDENGNYKIYLSKGYHILTYKYMGMQPTLRKVQLYSDGILNVKLQQKINVLEEIYVSSAEEKEEREIIGYSKLKLLDISEIPTLMGETDIVKHSLLLPGIQSVGEMDMSFSVRGGKGDQNLILIDGMNTYSNSHFFGFFPGINPSSISDAKLYKASIPIEFGNRLSSVFDINVNKGNPERFELEGGISPVSSNISINGPIIKDKLTFTSSYRGTYSTWVLDLIDIEEFENSTAEFYDFNTKIFYKPNPYNSYSIFYTQSYDEFAFNRESIYKTYNTIASINTRNYLSEKLVMDNVLGFSDYSTNRIEIPSDEYSNTKEHNLLDFKLNNKYTYNYNDQNKITAGLDLVYQQIKPWNIKPYNELSLIKEKELYTDKAINASLYLGDQINLYNKITIDIGARLVSYFHLGENNKFIYDDNISELDIIDTVYNSNNEIIDKDFGLEYRIAGNYKLNRNQNINFGYNRNRQYISILTNTQAITPVSYWQLSNEYIPPQIADQISLGYNFTSKNNFYFISLDIYYKNIQNIKDFKNGSKFELNQHPETEIVNAKGKAYGVEFLLKKKLGRLSGWVSYTYSRSFTKSISNLDDKTINNGDYYPSSYDKPHNISAILNYEPTKRLIISNVFNYSSGIPCTLPESKIMMNDSYFLVYSERNKYRLPYYFRWDISLSFKGSLKKDKLLSSLWTFSIYNILGRNNPYSVYFENNDNKIEGYQVSIFGSAIPTLTYKFTF